jgi:hypothetical protein
MAEKLVDIFQTHPSLLIEKFQEVKEFFNNYRILKTSNGEFYIHLVSKIDNIIICSVYSA